MMTGIATVDIAMSRTSRAVSLIALRKSSPQIVFQHTCPTGRSEHFHAKVRDAVHPYQPQPSLRITTKLS